MVKFTNIIIREIYTYLGFEEIFSGKIYYLNKKFYHNFAQDNEAAIRMFYSTFNIIYQDEHEKEYLAGVKALDESCEDFKDAEEVKLQRTYEQMDCQELVAYVHKIINRKINFKHFVLAFRTTGGYYSDYYSMKNMFDSRICYCSAPMKEEWDGIVSVTGIAIEIGDDEVMMKELIQKINQAKSAL